MIITHRVAENSRKSPKSTDYIELKIVTNFVEFFCTVVQHDGLTNLTIISVAIYGYCMCIKSVITFV